MIRNGTFKSELFHPTKIKIELTFFENFENELFTIFIKNFIHAWWESTKWISWKEFAQTGPEKVCDKVIINKLE
jgi:hypothetical protein